MFGQLLTRVIPMGFSFFSKKATLMIVLTPFDLGAYITCFYLAHRLVTSSGKALLPCGSNWWEFLRILGRARFHLGFLGSKIKYHS